MATALKKLKGKFRKDKSKGKTADNETAQDSVCGREEEQKDTKAKRAHQGGNDSLSRDKHDLENMTKLSPPDASNVHNGSKPVSQSASSNQESFNGSKENDLKTAQANLTSVAESGPNSLDLSHVEDSSYAIEGPPIPASVHVAASQNLKSEPAGGPNVIISEEGNVADSPNQEASVVEAAAVSLHGVHDNQEINASTSGTITDVTHVNQEGTAVAAAVVAPAATAAAIPPPPHETQNSAGEAVAPLDISFASLTPHPIQEEGENTDTEGPTHIEPPQEQEDTANTEGARGNDTAVQEEAGNRYNNFLVSEVIQKEKFLQDKLACKLDHTAHRSIRNWEHLACTEEVNAPLETRLRCKLNSENSCTLMLIDFLAVEKEDKTVQDLTAALKNIKRNDVVKLITDVYPDAANSTETISDFAASNTNSEMIKEIATKLDQRSRVNACWLDLGRQFEISGEKLKEIECGQFNPTEALIEYLYSKEEDPLTVGRFYKAVQQLKRGDVLKLLQQFFDVDPGKLMQDAIPLESDDMRKICVCLNTQNRALKNWRNLANAFTVPREIYKDFNPEILGTKL